MDLDNQPNKNTGQVKERGFFASILFALLDSLVKFVTAFAVGTGAGAIFCWYYGLPMIIALVGGFLAVGLALAFMSDGIFS